LRSNRDQHKRDDSMRCDSLGRRVPSPSGGVAESLLFRPEVRRRFCESAGAGGAHLRESSRAEGLFAIGGLTLCHCLL
jgi:hypothetical protein